MFEYLSESFVINNYFHQNNSLIQIYTGIQNNELAMAISVPLFQPYLKPVVWIKEGSPHAQF